MVGFANSVTLWKFIPCFLHVDNMVVKRSYYISIYKLSQFIILVPYLLYVIVINFSSFFEFDKLISFTFHSICLYVARIKHGYNDGCVLTLQMLA